MPDTPDRPVIADAALSVVLLAPNLGADLQPTIEGWIAYLDSLARTYEILLVDTSGTAQPAEALVGRFPRVRNLPSATAGLGAALRAALATAQLPLLCYAECSAAYQPADLGRMLEVIDNVDLVSGYRQGLPFAPDGGRLAAMARRACWFQFGVCVKDADCPFKLFRRSIFQRIPIQSESAFVHTEIVAKANFLTCLIEQVPVQYTPLPGRGTSISTKWSWADLVSLQRHPDFGPARLPVEHTAAPARYNVPMVKVVFYLPLKDNDGRSLKQDIEDLEMELYLHFVGWTSLGLVRGAYRMASGVRVIDTCEAYAVGLDPERISELEQVVQEFKRKTSQEAIYLEVHWNVEIRFI
jgi:hypothetical protein